MLGIILFCVVWFCSNSVLNSNSTENGLKIKKLEDGDYPRPFGQSSFRPRTQLAAEPSSSLPWLSSGPSRALPPSPPFLPLTARSHTGVILSSSSWSRLRAGHSLESKSDPESSGIPCLTHIEHLISLWWSPATPFFFYSTPEVALALKTLLWDFAEPPVPLAAARLAFLLLLCTNQEPRWVRGELLHPMVVFFPFLVLWTVGSTNSGEANNAAAAGDPIAVAGGRSLP